MAKGSAVQWLRASYWVGAITDALAAVAMLVPAVGAAMYGRENFSPSPDYRYAMGLGASLMLGWTALLVWADRKPIERRGVLLLTIPVIGGLAAAGCYAVHAELVAVDKMIPTWVMQAGLVALYVHSYRRAG